MAAPQPQNNLRSGEGAYVSGRYSGLITTVAAGDATNGHLWAMRFATLAGDKRAFAVIQRLRMKAVTIAGFTGPQEVLLALYKLTGYTVAHSGQTALTVDKKRASAPAALMTGRIAGAAQLTAGTHVIGTDSIRAGSSSELANAATVQHGAIDIFMSTEDLAEHPIVLANNEGLLLRNEILMGAGGTVRLVAEVDWLEVVRY